MEWVELQELAKGYAPSRFGPNLVRQEPIWSPEASRASSLEEGSAQSGGQPLVEAVGIEAASDKTAALAYFSSRWSLASRLRASSGVSSSTFTARSASNAF